MKKIYTVVLILVVNFGFSQLNGVYKSKDNLYKLKISNYSKQDQSFNFVWEAIDPNDICSCGGEGIAQEDTYEPKNGEFFLTADDPQGGFNNILQFNLKPNNILDVKVVGDINNLWLCGSGCRIGNEIFYKDGESEANKLPEPTAQNYYENGNIKFKSKDFKGAIEDYSNAINLSPECSFCYQLRGFSKGELNDYDGSISDYKKAIELSDGNLDFISPCQLNIGITYCVIGKKEEGCNFLKDSQNNGNKEAQKYIDQFCGESEPNKQLGVGIEKVHLSCGQINEDAKVLSKPDPNSIETDFIGLPLSFFANSKITNDIGIFYSGQLVDSNGKVLEGIYYILASEWKCQ